MGELRLGDLIDSDWFEVFFRQKADVQLFSYQSSVIPVNSALHNIQQMITNQPKLTLGTTVGRPMRQRDIYPSGVPPAVEDIPSMTMV